VLSGDTEFVRAAERQREALLEETRKCLSAPVSAEELHAHFATLPARYFEIRGAKEIALDLDLAHRFMRLQVLEEDDVLQPVVGWQDDADRGYSAVKVCTWDREGLFSHIAGALSAAGLNILSAQIFTRTDGIAMDTFYVTDAKTGVLASTEQQEKLEGLLAKVLTGHAVDFRALIARQRSSRPLYQGYEGEGIPTQVRLANDASDHRTLIEVETEDHIGLLHALSQTLSALRLDISAAKICMERGAAIDSFYVTEIGDGRIQDPERLKHIERKLRQAIDGLGRA
jgi:[protein-PII] uridylyltransferase